MAYESVLFVRTELDDKPSDTGSKEPTEEFFEDTPDETPLKKLCKVASQDLESREALLQLLEKDPSLTTDVSVQRFLELHGEFIVRSRLEALIARNYTERNNISELRRIIKNDTRIALFSLSEQQILVYILKRKLALYATRGQYELN